MKRSPKFWAFLLFSGWCGLIAALAQTNGIELPPPIDPVKAPLPKTIIEYWQFAIPIVVPLVIAGLKWFGAKLPRRVIPAVNPVLGILLGLGMTWLTDQNFSWMSSTVSALAGFAATGFREAVDQNIVQPNQSATAKINELKYKIVEVQDNPKATI